MKLNLTNADRLAVYIDFEVNKFVMTTQNGVLLGKYISKARMQAEMKENGIKPGNVKMSSMAARQYLANYGNDPIPESPLEAKANRMEEVAQFTDRRAAHNPNPWSALIAARDIAPELIKEFPGYLEFHCDTIYGQTCLCRLGHVPYSELRPEFRSI